MRTQFLMRCLSLCTQELLRFVLPTVHAIMMYATANKLSYTSIENLLKLFHFLCPSPHDLPSSLYMLKRFFRQFTSNYDKKSVCPTCEHVLKKGESCPIDHGQSGRVVQVPIEKALKTVVISKLDVELIRETPPHTILTTKAACIP